ncbi:MarR family transcriptional regulator [Sphingomonas sp. CGMCC 1.13654]|uniref:MarR family transcriptional regulator n=1 Tax=Sphingomonas chungangi TaxID=2683589 RepID=A0A838L1Q0_9SPHN|nr:MarR family transcriptional regulator [Sphingomonas chungangi]MBA2933114.1 MarR family transcriptional regulator [Sphingomonas chungangi]MVW56734.1 MarR family transcriptional regulator [Sphingomonas chungangi]
MAVLKIEDCATNRAPGRLLRRIDRLMAAFVESRFESLDISFMQWIALKVIRDGVATTAGELARELSITTGATTRLIDVLETRGLVERDRGKADRRVVHLAITAKGIEEVFTLQQHVIEAWNEVLAEFDQDEVDSTVEHLVRLLEAAERVVGAAAIREIAE